MLWNGNNENIWGYADWGWQERLDGRTWGAGYYFDLLPADRGRARPDAGPTAPGSPWSLTTAHHPNDPRTAPCTSGTSGTSVDYTAYRDYVPRFVAEFGFQGPPAWSTLTPRRVTTSR